MAEPQIQYCTSADGTRIAYVFSEEGREPPILIVNSVFLPIGAARLGHTGHGPELAVGRRYVRLDRRGVGYSQRDVTDFSLDAQVADVLAVATQAGLPQFDLVGFGDGCLVAAAFAARNPGRVRRMVLSTPTPVGKDSASQSLGTMARSNWPLARGAITDIVFSGNADGEARRAYIRLLAEVQSPETAASYLEAMWDPGPELGSIAMPTLVMYPRRRLAGPMEISQMLAAAIPGARFLAHDGAETSPAHLAAVREFFGDVEPTPDAQPSTSAPSAPSGMAVVLFTDIVDSTALTERLGDTVFRTASRALDEAMRTAMRDAGGTPVEGKVLGDGVMGVFTSASQAINAARRCIELSAESELQLHVGLHAGDVIHEKGNVYGGAVNIASRICGLSAPGEVLVSGTVRELARTSAGVEFADRGEQALKGIDDAVRVYEVRWRE